MITLPTVLLSSTEFDWSRRRKQSILILEPCNKPQCRECWHKLRQDPESWGRVLVMERCVSSSLWYGPVWGLCCICKTLCREEWSGDRKAGFTLWKNLLSLRFLSLASNVTWSTNDRYCGFLTFRVISPYESIFLLVFLFSHFSPDSLRDLAMSRRNLLSLPEA